MWLDWKLTGVLPYAGGTLDQTPEFMRDLRVIENLVAQWEKVGRQKAEIKRQIRGSLK